VFVKLSEQVNLRRIARGKEPLRLAHIERAIRFIAGPKPPPGRPDCFNAKQRVIQRPPELRDTSIEARRAYVRAARGRAA
jgi:hypothetical protein